MPTRAPTDRELARARQASNARTNAERRAVRGPDPRSTRRWQRLRALVLAEAPLCADPHGVHRVSGRVEVATEVDHIVGVYVDSARVFDRENLQGLCSACHSRKSAEERRG